MTTGRPCVALLEELNFNAWPALRTVHYDGWLLRMSGGDSRRVNSVNPLTPGVLALPEKVATAEAIYRRWGRRAIFRLTPLADAGLDETLADRGYVLNGATFVQTAEIAARQVPAEVDIRPSISDGWINAAQEMRGHAAEEAPVFAAQHRAVGVETGWAMARRGGAPAAVGAVAMERGWAGLHGIYVAKAARRAGLGFMLSEALLGYAYAKGARRAWLQVEQANVAALPLYARLGFAIAYSYVHRVRPA